MDFVRMGLLAFLCVVSFFLIYLLRLHPLSVVPLLFLQPGNTEVRRKAPDRSHEVPSSVQHQKTTNYTSSGRHATRSNTSSSAKATRAQTCLTKASIRASAEGSSLGVPLLRYPTTDIHVCAIVRTYQGQAATLNIAIESILYQANIGIDVSISVINTGASEMQWSNLPKDVRICISPIRHVDNNVETWGYVETDQELHRIREGNNKIRNGAKSCTHILVTNGDNYYRPGVFQDALPYLRKGYPAVSYSFVTTSRHVNSVSGMLRVCAFKHGQVDLGSVLLNIVAMSNSNLTFEKVKSYCNSASDWQARCAISDDRPYWVADWGFVHSLAIDTVNFVCVNRVGLITN